MVGDVHWKFAVGAIFTVLAHADKPELYGLPRDPKIPLAVKLWKTPLKWLGNLAMVGGVLGVAIHYLRFGPKDEDEKKEERR